MFDFDVVTGPTSPTRPAKLEAPPAAKAPEPPRRAAIDAGREAKPATADPTAPRA